MANLFKRRSAAGAAEVRDLTESETALAQSTYNVEKITEIQGRFTGGETLLVPGRIFIREGMLWKVCRKGPKRRHFFLFNDVLVYGSVSGRGRYTNQHHLPLARMSVSASCHYLPQVSLEGDINVEELDPENAFQISHADKSFHVYAQSKADKGNWISNLHKQISKVASSNADKPGQVLFRAVWVPDAAGKTCMVCKRKFTPVVRKHHCRMCGRIVCSGCSPHKVDIAVLVGAEPSSRLERVCSECNRRSPSQQEKTRGVVVVRREEEGDSTETEDSDDSDVEQPVPPPRRKKNQQQRKAPPPRPPPPQIRIKKQVQELPNEQSQVTNSDSAKDASATSVSVISVSVISASTTSASLISAPADQETTEVDVTAAKSRDEDFNEEQQQVSSESSSEEESKQDNSDRQTAPAMPTLPSVPRRRQKLFVQLEEPDKDSEGHSNSTPPPHDPSASLPETRSPSMHARLRRSKFTTVPNS